MYRLPFVYMAPLKGHPQGVPCAELAPQVTEGFLVNFLHQAKDSTEKFLHRLTTVPLVLSGPLCPAGISPPRGESPLSGEAFYFRSF